MNLNSNMKIGKNMVPMLFLLHLWCDFRTWVKTLFSIFTVLIPLNNKALDILKYALKLLMLLESLTANILVTILKFLRITCNTEVLMELVPSRWKWDEEIKKFQGKIFPTALSLLGKTSSSERGYLSSNTAAKFCGHVDKWCIPGFLVYFFNCDKRSALL